jgi:hypothetical protein
MTMLAEYVITSKLFYGFVHHSKKNLDIRIYVLYFLNSSK